MKYAEFMRKRRETVETARRTPIADIGQNEIELLKELISEKAAEIAESFVESDESPMALELRDIARESLIDMICRELKENG